MDNVTADQVQVPGEVPAKSEAKAAAKAKGKSPRVEGITPRPVVHHELPDQASIDPTKLARITIGAGGQKQVSGRAVLTKDGWVCPALEEQIKTPDEV